MNGPLRYDIQTAGVAKTTRCRIDGKLLEDVKLVSTSRKRYVDQETKRPGTIVNIVVWSVDPPAGRTNGS